LSANPFSTDARIRDRIAALRQSSGAAIEAEIASFVGTRGGATDDNLGSVVPAAVVNRLIRTHGLNDAEELMLVALPVAQKLATPPLSSYFVGCIGLEAETGNLVLGGNIEFPGTHLGYTVHGEGFVFTRAFSRDTAIKTIALREAHPCAHCRQYLSEFAATKDLTLIDTLGHRLKMADLYPWPFDPAYLEDKGVVTGDIPRPDLQLGPHTLSEGVATRLLEAGRRAHSPYSKCPGAVALTLTDGSIITGASIESVEFNPSMGTLQAAVVYLLAHGYTYHDITAAALGTVEEGAVDYSRSVAELLAAIAPSVRLTVVGFRG
jgi:cytidine deaminase